MSTYQQQIHCPASDIDMDFWRAPQGVAVPDDELSFLLVPDAVEAMAVFELAQQVHRYQQEQAAGGAPITRALMATMGGMLPGILLYDHLAKGRPPGTPRIDFGTIGVSLYKGPNERYENPRVQQDISIPVHDEVVLVIDDLGDRGGTMQFLTRYIAEKGAQSRTDPGALYETHGHAHLSGGLLLRGSAAGHLDHHAAGMRRDHGQARAGVA